MLKNSIIYILAEIINKGVPFLLLPILTHYLTPYDYGIIASFSSFIGMLSIFIGLSIHGAINVNFFKYSKDKLRVYIANALFLLVATILLVIIFIYFTKIELSQKFLLDSQWLYLAIIISSFQVITLVNLTLWLAEKKPKEYSFYQISQTILTSTLSIVLIVGYNMNWQGQLLSLGLGSISFGILSLHLLNSRGYLKFSYDKKSIVDLLSFGFPLIPHQLSGWITISGDRLLLISLLGASATGLFSIGYQIGMIMSVIVTAFHKAWNPFIYEHLSRGMNLDEKKMIVKYTYIYFISIVFLVFFLNFLGFYIFKYWINSNFIDSYKYVIYILIEYGLNGMYFMIVSYLFFFKRTKVLAMITFLSSIIHFLLSLVFIKLYGAIGVAYSGIISYFIMFLGVFWYSQKIYPLPWLFWRYR